MTGEDPLWLNHGYAELKRFLVLDSGAGDYAARRLCAARRCSGSSTDEMGGVNLDLVAPFCAHVPESHLRVLKQDFILDCPEADGYARGVSHGVCTHTKKVRRVDASSGPQNELEGIFGIKLETRDFGGCIAERRRDSRDTLAITVKIERTKLGGGKFESGPLQGNRGLSDVTQLYMHETVAKCTTGWWRTSSLGLSGVLVPNSSRISL